MSALTILALRRCDPDALDAVAQQLLRGQLQLVTVLAVLKRRHVFADGWRGAASDAAASRYVSLSGRVLESIAGLGTSAACVNAAASRLRTALDLLRRAGAAAELGGGHLSDRGQLVLAPPPFSFDPAQLAVHARRETLLRADVQALVARALSVAQRVDDELARALAATAGGGPPSVATVTLVAGGAVTPPPPGAGPLGAYENAAWWLGLTPQQQRQAVSQHPEWVGPRDGITAAARHQANLLLLGRLESEARTVRMPIARSSGLVHDALVTTPRLLTELQAVRDVLGRHDGGDRTLLMIDGSGDLLKAVVAVGDLDTAEHVATMVAGFTTTVGDGLRGADQTANRLKSQAAALGPDRLAIVTWMGYPAPQWGGLMSPSRSVVGSGLAQQHAEDLAKFADGIDASRAGAVHQTQLAHSYGSVVAGYALLQPHPYSEVGVYGSPGLPFASVSGAGLKPGSLNVLRAEGDFVAANGPLLLGHRAETVTGSVWLSTRPAKDAVNTYTASHGHSEYLRPGTSSERNLLAMMVGRTDLLKKAGYRERTEHARQTGLRTWSAGPRSPASPFTPATRLAAPTHQQVHHPVTAPVR